MAAALGDRDTINIRFCRGVRVRPWDERAPERDRPQLPLCATVAFGLAGGHSTTALHCRAVVLRDGETLRLPGVPVSACTARTYALLVRRY